MRSSRFWKFSKAIDGIGIILEKYKKRCKKQRHKLWSKRLIYKWRDVLQKSELKEKLAEKTTANEKLNGEDPSIIPCPTQIGLITEG